MDPASTAPGTKSTCLAEASSVMVVMSAFRPEIESRILGLLCRIFDGSNRRPNCSLVKEQNRPEDWVTPNRSRMIRDARPVALEAHG